MNTSKHISKAIEFPVDINMRNSCRTLLFGEKPAVVFKSDVTVGYHLKWRYDKISIDGVNL